MHSINIATVNIESLVVAFGDTRAAKPASSPANGCQHGYAWSDSFDKMQVNALFLNNQPCGESSFHFRR